MFYLKSVYKKFDISTATGFIFEFICTELKTYSKSQLKKVHYLVSVKKEKIHFY